MISGFFEESIVKKAQEKKLVEINIINLRDFAIDSYGTVDDRPYGGGAGMVIRPDVVNEAIVSVKSPNSDLKKTRVFLTSPKGKKFHQGTAKELSSLDHIIIIAGHYEDIDSRVLKLVDEEISLGDFILTGGEIAASAIVDSVVRLIPGVLKKEAATKIESFFNVDIDSIIKAVGTNKILENIKSKGIKSVKLLEYPQYTRPEEFLGDRVPEVLLKGDHKKIEEWKIKMAFEETVNKRPDLLDVSFYKD